MKVERILIDPGFRKQFAKLPLPIQKKAEKARLLFVQNPFHPSLRLHKLSGRMDGLWSISITMRYRIVFRVYEGGDVLFISIGTHAIYT